MSDAYLDSILVGGREEREVVLVDYDESWPRVFEEHRDRIVSALQGAARRVEHVGSTAVPGLAAKPIVDIMVTVDDPDDEPSYRGRLEDAGYVLRVREVDHRMFRTPAQDVHLHIWRVGSHDEQRHLVFRDRLRSNPADRMAYEALKRSLAGRWRDMNYYAEAKGPFIRRVLETAGMPPEEHPSSGLGLNSPDMTTGPDDDAAFPQSGAEVLSSMGGDRESGEAGGRSRLSSFFECWLDTFLFQGRVDPKLRELAILRMMWRCQRSFEWANHYRLARDVGLTPEEIVAVRTPDPQRDLPTDVAIVVRAADDVADRGYMAPETYDAVRELFSDLEVVQEFVYLVAGYRMFASVSATTGHTAETQGLRVWPPDGLGPEEPWT